MEITVFLPVNVLVQILLEPSDSGKMMFENGWKNESEDPGASSSEGLSNIWLATKGSFSGLFVCPLSALAMPVVARVSVRAASVPVSARLSLILLCLSVCDRR